MHNINKLWKKIFESRYQESWKKCEYLELKYLLKKGLLPFLLIAIIGILIPYTIQFFIKDLTPQNFIFITLFPIAISGLLIWQRMARKCADLFLTVLIIAIIAILTTGYRDLLPQINQNESFYTGYSFAMVVRLIGYNMLSLKCSILIFLIQIPLKFSLVQTFDALQIIIVLALDLATIVLRCKSEVVERDIFDKLYKLEKSVPKFNLLLKQYILNPIAIFPSDYSKPYFANNTFKRTFKVCDLNLAKGVLENLIIEPDTIEKHKSVFKHLGFQNYDESVSLITVMNALSLEVEFLSDIGTLDLQVIREDEIPHGDDDDSYRRDEKIWKRVFKLRIFPLIWDDMEAIGIVFENITLESRNRELELAERNRVKVISMVSHELRAPVNGILGILDIVKKSIKEPETLKHLKVCQNMGVWMLNLINSMLDMNQAKNKRLRLVYSKFSLSNLLNEIKDLFDPNFKVKDLYLKVEIDARIPKMIITDRTRLNQILINLVGNALKFTLSGGVTLEVSLVCEKSTQLKFSVKDTGVGISQENQQILLRRMKQRDWSTKNQRIGPQGTGLGLIISTTLVELLNPTENQGLCIESEGGVGTCFSFIIEPQDNLEASNMAENYEDDALDELNEEQGLTLQHKINAYINPSANNLNKMVNVNPEDLTDRKTAKPWCLIVDDSPFCLMVMSHIMEEKGYQVKMARNGAEAISHFKEHETQGLRFRLTLMDCQMPVMNGYKATKIIKELMKNGELHESPIIAITANARTEEHDTLCHNVGMNGQLSKPLQIEDLESILAKLK